MKKMKHILILTAVLISAGCMTSPSAFGPVALGDPEPIMIAKMRNAGARDATSETPSEFYHQISWDQRYYWWELPDKTVVAVLVAAPEGEERTVVVIETGEPGHGIEGTREWRSQKLNCQTLMTKKRQNKTPEHISEGRGRPSENAQR